MATTTDDQR
jgi:hypothetical protein